MEGISYTVGTKRGERMKNKRLKLARVEKDLSQAELAEIVGVTRQTIGLIEAGGYNPTLNLCIAICKALDKTLENINRERQEQMLLLAGAAAAVMLLL